MVTTGWNRTRWNHRAILLFNGKGNLAKATINWRRRMNFPSKTNHCADARPARKSSMYIPLKSTENEVLSCLNLYQALAPIMYYMPYIYEGPTYVLSEELWKPERTTDETWLNQIESSNTLSANCIVKKFRVSIRWIVLSYEVIATAAETKSLLDKNKDKLFWSFLKTACIQSRMKNDLPQRWIVKEFKEHSRIMHLGEYLAFSIGDLYASREIKGSTDWFSDLKSNSGKMIAAKTYPASIPMVSVWWFCLSNQVDVSKEKIPGYVVLE